MRRKIERRELVVRLWKKQGDLREKEEEEGDVRLKGGLHLNIYTRGTLRLIGQGLIHGWERFLGGKFGEVLSCPSKGKYLISTNYMLALTWFLTNCFDSLCN